MRFEILNVEHGFAGFAVGRDGGVLLFDCGRSSTVRPSTYLSRLGVTTIRRLFITNYDEDHISDLIELRRKVSVDVLTRNASLTSAQIRGLKSPPTSPAMNELLDMIDSYTWHVGHDWINPLGLQVSVFHNHYPTFTDTNNLSLLTFLTVGDLSFALGGDLEKDGWASLLESPQVRQRLSGVNVFVASHHGRESGYCREVFDYCDPSLIVISDGPIRQGTQEMASTYARHARGEYLNRGGTNEFRRVVTTRKDGNLSWNV